MMGLDSITKDSGLNLENSAEKKFVLSLWIPNWYLKFWLYKISFAKILYHREFLGEIFPEQSNV